MEFFHMLTAQRAIHRLAVIGWLGLFGLTGLSARVAEAAAPPERIFPDSTILFLKLNDVKAFGEAFRGSQYGQLWNDPGLKDFKEDLAQRLDDASKTLKERIGVSIKELLELPRGALVLSLFGVRPGVLDAESVPVADMLAAFGGAMLTNATAYHQAQRTASQLKDAVVARSVVDQAKGILMHALGCDADEALAYLRRESQRRHVKVTEVAARIVAAPPRRDSGGRR